MFTSRHNRFRAGRIVTAALALFFIISACSGNVTGESAGADQGRLNTPEEAEPSPDFSQPLAETSATRAALVTAETGLPTATAAETPTSQPAACTPTFGTVDVYQVDSAALGRKMTARVYLPPCYDAQKEGGYPVVYLLHGQSADDHLWDDLGADETADFLIREGFISPMILIMPREDYFLQDLGDSRFDDALLDTLVPWVDETFNTCAERACRAIGGISRGAVWAIRVGLTNWDQFGAVGAHSVPDSPYSTTRLTNLHRAMPAGDPTRLYVDIGDTDGYINGARRFVTALELAGYPHEFHLGEGGHNQEYWKAEMEDYLRWYAAGW